MLIQSDGSGHDGVSYVLLGGLFAMLLLTAAIVIGGVWLYSRFSAGRMAERAQARDQAQFQEVEADTRSIDANG